MLERIKQSISLKVLIAVYLATGAVVGTFSYLTLAYQRKALIENTTNHIDALGETIKRSLELDMLARQRDHIEQVLETIVQHKDLADIFILDSQGTVRLSPKRNLTKSQWKQFKPSGQIYQKVVRELKPKTFIYTRLDGQRVLRNFNPILNKPECYTCHDPQNKLNGILVTDASMKDIEVQLAGNTTRLVLGGLLTFVVLTAIIGFCFRKLVFSPLKRLAKGAKEISAGNLQYRIARRENDEMGQVVEAFNHMGSSLASSINQLKNSMEFTDNVIKTMVSPLLVVNKEGHIEMVNQAALTLSGYQEGELLGQELLFLFHRGSSDGKEEDLFPYLLQEGYFASDEIQLRTKDGRSVAIDFHSSPLYGKQGELQGIVITAEDVEEIKKLIANLEQARAKLLKKSRDLEEEIAESSKELERTRAHFVQWDKLASVGQLAAGVAHEINNPLGSILTYSKLLKRELNTEDNPPSPAVSQLLQYIETIGKEAYRCSHIIRSLLDFSRLEEGPFKVEPIDINVVLNEMIELLKHQAQMQHVTIIRQLEPNPPSVMGNFAQLHQAFFNVTLNAIQAMPHGGQLLIVSRSTVDDITLQEKQIEVEIADTGFGIEEKNLPRLFDPFFTTKKPGEGTGLGLSVVYGVIHRHQGSITVESQKERGTKFVLRLPVYKEEPVSAQGPKEGVADA